MTLRSLRNLPITVRSFTRAATATDSGRSYCRRVARRGLATLIGTFLVCQTCLLPAQQSTSSSAPLKWVRQGGQSAGSTAQHSLSLAQPTDPRPVDSHVPVTVLRWRTPSVAQATVSAPAVSTPIKVLTVSAPGNERGRVQQALATAPAIPYLEPASDTFGDNRPQRGLPPQELPSADSGRQLMIELVTRTQEEEPGIAPEATNPPSPSDLAPEDLVPDDPVPDGLVPDDPAPAPQPLPEPAPDSPSSPRAATCDRIYNERDCCEDDKRCESARQFWQHDALAKISLDITPQLRPEETDPYQEESQRNADLAKAPVRTWHDRQGNVVATGRLNNIQRGRLLLLDENNQIVRIPFRELCDDDLCFLTAWWRVPTECTFGEETYEGRSWQASTLTWKASGVCHKPLYFEEPQLERYGHTTGHIKQPLLSGAHFFLNLVALPYNAGINPPWECQYPLGYYRPGSCAPWLVPPVPLSVRGALWQAGAVVGGIALIP
ncbi:MAG: hypothetical protein ACYC0X_06320 [Pirellulaceae bacterium]